MKERGIETLRGIVIVLVVMAHVIGTHGNGLDVRDDSFLRWLFRLTINFRMPLFTVLSGYVYSLRPVKRGHLGTFWRAKARRILYPLVCVSTLQYLVNWAVPGTHYAHRLGDIWRIYFFTYDQFWFLQAMLLVFLIVPLLEWSGCFDTFRSWSTTLVAAVLAHTLMPQVIVPFSFDGFLFLLGAFVLGVGLQRYPDVLGTRTARYVSGVLLGAFVAVQQIIDFRHLPIALERNSLLGLISGLDGAVFFFSLRGAGFTPLARLGGHAYPIFLFHRFGQAGSRIMMRALGVSSIPVLFAAGMICGILVPLVLEWVFRQTRLTRTLLLGEDDSRGGVKRLRDSFNPTS